MVCTGLPGSWDPELHSLNAQLRRFRFTGVRAAKRRDPGSKASAAAILVGL